MTQAESQPSSTGLRARAARRVKWYRSISVRMALVLGVFVFSIQLLVYVLIVESFRSRMDDLDTTGRVSARPFADYLAENVEPSESGAWVPTSDALHVVGKFLDEGETYVWLDSNDRVAAVGSRLEAYTQVGELWPLCNSREYCPVELSGGEVRAGSSWSRLAIRGRTIGTFVLIWFEDTDITEARERQAQLDLYLRLIGAALLATLTSLLLVSRVTRRLSRLATDASTPPSEHDYFVDIPGPFKVEGDDEIARLATALNTMRDRIEELVQRIEDRDRQRRDWIAQVSHDLRTPLTALTAGLDRARSTTDAAQKNNGALEAILAARQDAVRLQSLVEDLFELARLDAKDELVLEPVPPGELVRQTVRGLGPMAEAEGVELTANVAPALPTIRADGRRLMRALENMVRNAAHFGESKVEVLVQCDGDDLRFEVRDDGPGLPSVNGTVVLAQTNERPRRPDSAGLGLIVTRRVAEAHGGVLEGKNRPEGGACVWIRIPIVKSH